MNYSEILAQRKAASAFDLYRLRAAIDRVLDEPAWLVAVQARLNVGQTVEYFDPQANASHVGQVLELRRKQAVVLDKATGQRWLIAYAAIKLDGADVEIREKPRQGLGRNEVAIGDRVGFVGRDRKERSGHIIRGAFSLADPDIFKLVNFNHQAGATRASIGRAKVDVLSEMALGINPELGLRLFPAGVSADNLQAFFENVDFYVDGLDFFAVDIRRKVFAHCHLNGILAITAAPLGMGAALPRGAVTRAPAAQLPRGPRGR